MSDAGLRHVSRSEGVQDVSVGVGIPWFYLWILGRHGSSISSRKSVSEMTLD